MRQTSRVEALRIELPNLGTTNNKPIKIINNNLQHITEISVLLVCQIEECLKANRVRTMAQLCSCRKKIDLVDLCLNCCAIWQLFFDIDVIITIVPLFFIALIIFAYKEDAKDQNGDSCGNITSCNNRPRYTVAAWPLVVLTC